MHSSAELVSRSIWPDQPLPSQAIITAPAWRDGDQIRYPDEWEPDHAEALPDEWVLRELPRLDLADPDVTVEVVQRHGVLGWPRTPLRLPANTEIPRPETQAIPITDAARYLRAGRALVRHWIALQDKEDPTPAWQDEGFKVADDLVAEESFRVALNAGLDAYSPRIEDTYTTGASTQRWSVDDDLIRGAPRPDLYEGIALQVFNLVSEHLPILVCSNETCGRFFCRQQGRSGSGRTRTSGVRYCTSKCAKARTQREYKKRKQSRSRAAPGQEPRGVVAL